MSRHLKIRTQKSLTALDALSDEAGDLKGIQACDVEYEVVVTGIVTSLAAEGLGEVFTRLIDFVDQLVGTFFVDIEAAGYFIETEGSVCSQKDFKRTLVLAEDMETRTAEDDARFFLRQLAHQSFLLVVQILRYILVSPTRFDGFDVIHLFLRQVMFLADRFQQLAVV